MSNLQAMTEGVLARICLLLLTFSGILTAGFVPPPACLPMVLNPTQVAAAAYAQNSSAAASGLTGYYLVQVSQSTAVNFPNGDYQAWGGTLSTDPVNPGNLNAPAYTASTNGSGAGGTYNELTYTSVLLGEISYILNFKIGTVLDVQQAIWLVLNQALTNPLAINPSTVSANANAMYNAAITNGSTFVPGPGQRLAVFLVPLDATPTSPDANLILEMTACGQIGDRVWFDTNGNGLQDYTIVPSPITGFPTINYTEPGINGVTVQLKDSLGNLLSTTVTGPSPANYPYLPAGTSGFYQFTGLIPGTTYQVYIDNTQSALSGYSPTQTQVGTDNTVNSKPNPYTDTLPSANPAVDETVDFGYVTAAPPLSLTCAASIGEVGVPYSSSISVTGGVSPYTFSVSAGSLPAGLTLNTSTGAITGTPTTAGSFSFTVQVVDSSGTAANTKTSSCGITVAPALTLACVSASTGQVGVAYSSSLVASGGVPPYTYSIASGSLPAGLTLNASTGAITGVPTAYGPFSFTAQVADSSGLTGYNTVSSSCSITIAPPPIAVTCPTSTGTVNVPYTSSATATGGTGTYTWSITSGSLPAGLTLNAATGAITGTPTTAGVYTFTIQAKDTQGNVGSSNCSITVAPAPLTLTCPAGTAQAGVAYSSQAVATGGVTPYTFSVSAGVLPPGLTLNASTGAVTGTPTTAGSYSFTLKVTDSTGASKTANCSISVVAPQPLTLACPAGAGQVGVAYSSTPAVTGGVPPFTFSISAGSLPPGLTLNGLTGAVTGTPTTAGTYSFTLEVTDSTGAVAYSSCTASCGASSPTIFNFASSLGKLGTSQAYTAGGLTVTAYGFTNSGTAVNLHGKNTGGDEFGVGIDGESNEEIDTGHFIQLDLSQLEAAGVTNPQIMISSVQSGERYNIYGSNTVGSLGTKLVSGGALDITFFPIPSYPTYKYIAVQAASNDVDLAELSVPAGSCSIAIAPAPLAISCASNSATVGAAFNSAVTAGGGVAPYAFAVASGALPAGLKLNSSTGAITGTPTSSGNSSYSIKVTDSTGTSATTNCSITVAASGGTLYLLSGAASLSLTPGSGETSDTIPADNGANHDGTPTDYITYTISGITGTYNGGSTGFDLYLDSGTAVGNGVQLEVLYDFTGSGVYGRTEIYHYFATDNRVGWELYSPANTVQQNGLKSSTGTFANMNNGTVTIRLWNAIGKNPATVSVSGTASQGSQSIIVVPFTGVQ